MPFYKERQMSIQTEKEIELLMQQRLIVNSKLDLLAMMTDVEFNDELDDQDDMEAEIIDEEQ